MADPLFVDDNPNTVLQSVLSDFTNFTGKTLQPAQPEYLFCAAVAYREVLLRSRINAAGKSMLLAFSAAPVLDYLVELFGIKRLQPTKAVCTIHFVLIAGHGNINIPAGTRIRSTDGQVVFEMPVEIAVASDVNEVNVDVVAQVAGTAANGYAAGTITEIMDPQAYLSTASNLATTSGGSDQETDNQLRDRAFNAPSQYSVAGSRDAYKFHTFSVSPSIIDVAVLSHTEDAAIPYGEIRVYPLLFGGNVANTALVDAIEAVLTDDKIKPLNDTVSVLAPTQVQFSVAVNVTKLAKASSIEITAAITTALNAYRQAKIVALGIDIVNSEIAKVCLVDGLYDLEIVITPVGKSLTGDNLVIAGNEFGYLTDFTITITGSNNG